MVNGLDMLPIDHVSINHICACCLIVCGHNKVSYDQGYGNAETEVVHICGCVLLGVAWRVCVCVFVHLAPFTTQCLFITIKI